MKKCSTPRCRNNRAKDRKCCNTCNSRKWRKKHPLRYCYNALKQNSKRRNKEFTLSFEEFTKFCYETKYLAKKGQTKDSYTIDRKDSTKGYTFDNIQVLTLSENSRKGTKKVLVYDYQFPEQTYVATIKPFISTEEDPF